MGFAPESFAEEGGEPDTHALSYRARSIFGASKNDPLQKMTHFKTGWAKHTAHSFVLAAGRILPARSTYCTVVQWYSDT